MIATLCHRKDRQPRLNKEHFLVWLQLSSHSIDGVAVGKGDVLGTHLGTATSSFNAHAFGAGSAGHNDGLALHAEQVRKGLRLWDGNHLGGVEGVYWREMCWFSVVVGWPMREAEPCGSVRMVNGGPGKSTMTSDESTMGHYCSVYTSECTYSSIYEGVGRGTMMNGRERDVKRWTWENIC